MSIISSVLSIRQPLFAASPLKVDSTNPFSFQQTDLPWPSAIPLRICDNPKPNPEFIEQCKKAFVRFFTEQPAYLQACLLAASPSLNFQFSREGSDYVKKLEDAHAPEELQDISRRPILETLNQLRDRRDVPLLSQQEFESLEPPMTRVQLNSELLAQSQKEHKLARAVFVPHLNQINLHEFNGEGYNVTVSFHPVAEPHKLQNTLRHECGHFLNFKEFATFKYFQKSQDPFGLKSISNLKAFRQAVLTDIKHAFENKTLPLRKAATGFYAIEDSQVMPIVMKFGISDASCFYRFLPLHPDAWRYSFEEFCADALATAAFGNGIYFPPQFMETIFPNTLKFMRTVVLKRLQKKYTPSWTENFKNTAYAWIQKMFNPLNGQQSL